VALTYICCSFFEIQQFSYL